MHVPKLHEEYTTSSKKSRLFRLGVSIVIEKHIIRFMMKNFLYLVSKVTLLAKIKNHHSTTCTLNFVAWE